MKDKLVLFITEFKKLKSEVNNSPKNLKWLCDEKPILQEQCYKLNELYIALCKFFLTKHSRHTLFDAPFEKEWDQYKLYYAKDVDIVAQPVKKKISEELAKSLSESEKLWIESGKSSDDFWEMVNKYFPVGITFNPLNENPAELVESAFKFIKLKLEETKDYNTLEIADVGGDHYDTVIGAWDFFINTLKLDLNEIYNRWCISPELYILPHVSQSEDSPLLKLYHEAVRAYVYGAQVASIAMCRALMEHTLKNHYNVTAENLKNIIAIAERKHPQLKKFQFQKKRDLANNIMHDYENQIIVDDSIVVQFLRAIKELIQGVPNKLK